MDQSVALAPFSFAVALPRATQLHCGRLSCVLHGQNLEQIQDPINMVADACGERAFSSPAWSRRAQPGPASKIHFQPTLEAWAVSSRAALVTSVWVPVPSLGPSAETLLFPSCQAGRTGPGVNSEETIRLKLFSAFFRIKAGHGLAQNILLVTQPLLSSSSSLRLRTHLRWPYGGPVRDAYGQRAKRTQLSWKAQWNGRKSDKTQRRARLAIGEINPSRGASLG